MSTRAQREDEEESSSDWKKAAGILGFGALLGAAAYGIYTLATSEDENKPHTSHASSSRPNVRDYVPMKVAIECSICLELINYEHESVFLPCSHGFHRHCIKQWAQVHAACSTCRTKIDSKDLKILSSLC